MRLLIHFVAMMVFAVAVGMSSHFGGWRAESCGIVASAAAFVLGYRTHYNAIQNENR